MINKAMREARLNRISAFLRDVAAFYTAMTHGKTVKSRLSKLENYGMGLSAAKSDPALRPIAEQCEQLLALLTNGEAYDSEKKEKADHLLADIGKEVDKLWRLT